MRLSELLEPLQARLIGGDVTFEKLCTDSRQLQPGDLFVALRGEKFDGHDFAFAVVERGACAMVVEREISEAHVPQLVVADSTRALGAIAAYHRGSFQGTLVAVTGSSGKTSVKGLLREIFAIAGNVVATQGNFNNQIGVPLTLMNLAKQRYAVVEIGTNHPGEIGYLTQLARPDIAIVNNVSAAHIGGFGSLSAIAQEKGAIYSTLQPEQIAIINLDDTFTDQFIEATRHCRRIGFSLTKTSADFPVAYARSIVMDALGRASFEFCFGEDCAIVQLAVPGRHNVANALAAGACALAAGLSLAQIAIGLARFTGEKGRMQLFIGPHGSRIVDDTYNANPGSVRAAIDYLSQCPGRRILVLGDLAELGDAGPQAHREIGHYAAQKNISALLSHGPLSRISSEAFGAEGANFMSKAALIDALLTRLDADSTALIKGSRSARMEEIVQRVLEAKETPSC